MCHVEPRVLLHQALESVSQGNLLSNKDLLSSNTMFTNLDNYNKDCLVSLFIKVECLRIYDSILLYLSNISL